MVFKPPNKPSVTGELVAPTNRELTGIESFPTDDPDIEVLELDDDEVEEFTQTPAPKNKPKKK